VRAKRIGLVGTGNVAHKHVAGYKAVVGDRAVVRAACDVRSKVLEEFCIRYGVPFRFGNARDMVASGEVDVVVVLTPPQAREEVILPALEHRVAVLVEKPFGQSFAEAARYVAAAEGAGVPLAVGQNFRWFPEHQWMYKQLLKRRLGKPGYIEQHVFQDRPQPPGVWRAEQTRLEIAIFSVHLIDRIQWLAGLVPMSVSAVTRRDEESGLPGEQFTCLIVQFEDGLVGQMTSSWMARGLAVSAARVDGTAGSMDVERPNPMAGDAKGKLQLRSGPVEVREFADDKLVGDGARSYGYSLQAFLDAIEDGREPPHSGRDNLRTMAIMDAAYLSASRHGEIVDIRDVTGGAELPLGCLMRS